MSVIWWLIVVFGTSTVFKHLTVVISILICSWNLISTSCTSIARFLCINSHSILQNKDMLKYFFAKVMDVCAPSVQLVPIMNRLVFLSLYDFQDGVIYQGSVHPVVDCCLSASCVTLRSCSFANSSINIWIPLSCLSCSCCSAWLSVYLHVSLAILCCCFRFEPHDRSLRPWSYSGIGWRITYFLGK